MFDFANLQALLSMAYIRHAIDAFGAKGETGITTLLDTVRLIFQRIPPEALRSSLTVVHGMSTTPATPLTGKLGPVVAVADHHTLALQLAKIRADQFPFVEIMPDRTLRYLILDEDAVLSALASDALVYRFQDSSDRILVKSYDGFVPKPSPILCSAFASPTIDGLEAALERYGELCAETTCKVLSEVWEGGVDGPRLVLVNRPEAIMRDSLTNSLVLLLRGDVSVRAEQNTDETKTVDIRIEWFASGASALIEIKWLGRSTAKQQRPRSQPSYTDYGEPRARDGAAQLADYLDRQIRHTSAIVQRGYLVVFDARRRNISGAFDLLPEEDATYYRDAVIEYRPDYANLRPDFAPPVRYFLNPRRSHFAEAA
jgi:hypothetical protein